MGLPSGLLWASCNVGAAAPEDTGLYFSWGGLDGHVFDDGYSFSLDNYNASPAESISADLDLEQDAARAVLGAPWRMPLSTEVQELFDNCNAVMTTRNGVYGLLLTSNNNGAKLFLPADGYWQDRVMRSGGSSGYYWTASFVNSVIARVFLFYDGSSSPLITNSRRMGMQIRAVMKPVT